MKTIRRRLAAAMVVLAGMLALCAGARAGQDTPPAILLGAYQHSEWKTEDGIPADIQDMAQTRDGWLWIGTGSGVFRFDGVRFERAPGALGQARALALFAAPNGDLYVGLYMGGLMVLHPDGRIEDVPGADGPTLGPLGSFEMDADGSLWAMGSAIYRWDGKRWHTVDDDQAWYDSPTGSILLAPDGTMWAAYDKGIKRFDRASGRFVLVDKRGGSLSLAPDGSVWILPFRGAQAERVAAPVGAGARPARFNPSGSRFAGLFDAKGNLWKLNCPQALCLRAAQPGADVLRAAPPGALPLSGVESHHILEDREGNVWIATERGLDRFRPARLQQAGLSRSTTRMSIAADGEGRIWAADARTETLWELRAGRLPEAVAGPPVTMVVPGADGSVLLAGRRSIWRQGRGQRAEIPLPPGADGKPRDRTLLVMADDGRILWAAAPDMGLNGWDGQRWRPSAELGMTNKLYALIPGRRGQMWLGRAGGELVFYDNGKRTHYDAAALGNITGIFPGDEIVVGGDKGFGVLAGGRIRQLRTDDPEVLRGVSGQVLTPDGDRWFNGVAGVVRVRAEDWRRALAAPDTLLRYELFGPGDGYPGRAQVEGNRPSARSADGRLLWFMGTEGIAVLDSAAIRRNEVRPQPRVQAVLTAAGALAPDGEVGIAPGAGRIGIRFTAPSLRMPERVRFEYRLDGFDRGWQDNGARRMVEYTALPPGAYVFRVRAYNEDGLASADDASVALRIEPTLAQSAWFRALLGALLLALLVALYRYRVRYLTARVSERLRVKTAERERIARTLHDSFLQSLQAVLMRLDAAAARLTDTSARRELETIRAHANDALVEGRGHLEELRARDAVELDGAIGRSLEQLRATAPDVEFILRVQGERRPLDQAVAEEVGDIAREALRNAAAHAGARTVRVILGYGKRALTVSVADDGAGLPEEVARSGSRPGHWGLAGMRERAERIGGLLAIDSQPGRGVTVRLAVPAKLAYRER